MTVKSSVGHKKTVIIVSMLVLTVIMLLLAIGIGSVFVSPVDTLKILLSKLLGQNLARGIDESSQTIIVNIRLPRALLAFISGAGLAISGVIMQSVLRNPLASSYTLGVSSGAALGASLAIVLKISIFGYFTLQIFGLSFGLLTVILALFVATKLDKTMQSNTIILTGMAFSLFANAIITVFMAFSRSELQRLVFWQMGSFSLKDWRAPATLFPVVIIALIVVFIMSREMDIMTFGDEQAKASGVNVKRTKWILLGTSSIITGVIVSMTGIIGFVDLFVPHMARKMVGSQHKYVLLASALIGGCFMMACDMVARTIVSPLELPVGAITAMIGAPFFIYLYFSKSKSRT